MDLRLSPQRCVHGALPLLILQTGSVYSQALHPLQAFLTDGVQPLCGHAVHVQVVHEQPLRLLAQAVGAGHALREHLGILGQELQANSWHPVLTWQQRSSSWEIKVQLTRGCRENKTQNGLQCWQQLFDRQDNWVACRRSKWGAKAEDSKR